METIKKRNGTVDLLRILFCFIIIFHHVSKDLYGKSITTGGLFRNGALSVESFFIISGYYMCKSAYGIISKRASIDYTHESLKFLVKKILPLLFYHIILNAFMLIYYAITNNYSFDKIISLLPSFFFLPVVGFSDYQWILGQEWYIGQMLFAMAIIFPFLLKWFKLSSKYIAPIIGLCLLGYLMKEYHSVVHTNDMIRAFGGILLGVASFHGAEIIKEHFPKKITIISIVSFCLFLGYIVYMNCLLKDKTIQPVIILFIWFAFMVTFSERGLLSSTKLLNNSFVYYLGQISLPIYLVQNVIRHLVADLYENAYAPVRFVLTFCLIVVSGTVLYHIHNLILKIIRSKQIGTTKKAVCICLISLLILGAGTILGIVDKNQFELVDQELMNANEFKVVYHESDNMTEDDQTTLVVYGNKTRTLTIEELGYNQDHRVFRGWKVYRPDSKKWRIQNSDNETSWAKWLKKDESFYLYNNGCSISKTVKAGHTVHFYAQWEEE